MEEQIQGKDEVLATLEAQISEFQNQLEAARLKEIQVSDAPTPKQLPDHNQTQSTFSRREKTRKRRMQVLTLLQSTNSKDEVNFEAWGRDLGVSGQTVANDLGWLVEEGLWRNGSEWGVGISFTNEDML